MAGWVLWVLGVKGPRAGQGMEPRLRREECFPGRMGLVSDSQPTYLPTSHLPEAAAGPDGLAGGPRGQGHAWWVAEEEAEMGHGVEAQASLGDWNAGPLPGSGLVWTPGMAGTSTSRQSPEDRLRVLVR